MPIEKRFKLYLSADEILHVRLVHEAGTVEEFCVSYELIIMGVSYQPCRVDNAHGEVHVDVLNAQGKKIAREQFGPPASDRERIVTEAIDWMKAQVKFHRARILSELGVQVDGHDQVG